MSNEEMIQFWGEDSLVKWPRDLLARIDLPNDAKRFLAEVGLPCVSDWTMRFDLTLDQMQQATIEPRCFIIGYDYKCPILLDKQKRGSVISVEHGRNERFVNTDICRFGECLVLYQQYRLAVRAMDDEEKIQNLISNTENAMRAIDPTAFADANDWWAVIIEQMRSGLL
jgi:hypothetical protein